MSDDIDRGVDSIDIGEGSLFTGWGGSQRGEGRKIGRRGGETNQITTFRG